MDKSAKFKSSIQTLVTESQDTLLLEMVHEILNRESPDSDEISKMPVAEQIDLMKSYDESFDANQLIDLEEFKNKHK